MGGECGTYGRWERSKHGFGGGELRERDLGVDGRIILKCIFKKWDWGRGID